MQGNILTEQCRAREKQRPEKHDEQPVLRHVPPRRSAFEMLHPWKLRDELLDGEIFYTLREAKVLIEWCRWHYNTVRPHCALGYLAPREYAASRSQVNMAG